MARAVGVRGRDQNAGGTADAAVEAHLHARDARFARILATVAVGIIPYKIPDLAIADDDDAAVLTGGGGGVATGILHLCGVGGSAGGGWSSADDASVGIQRQTSRQGAGNRSEERRVGKEC